MRNLEFHPLTPALWPALESCSANEELAAAAGACGGGSVAAEWERQKGESNKKAFRKLVESQTPLGVLAFLDGEPIGWCAVGPRETLPSLARSRVLAPVPDWAQERPRAKRYS